MRIAVAYDDVFDPTAAATRPSVRRGEPRRRPEPRMLTHHSARPIIVPPSPTAPSRISCATGCQLTHATDPQPRRTIRARPNTFCALGCWIGLARTRRRVSTTTSIVHVARLLARSDRASHVYLHQPPTPIGTTTRLQDTMRRASSIAFLVLAGLWGAACVLGVAAFQLPVQQQSALSPLTHLAGAAGAAADGAGRRRSALYASTIPRRTCLTVLID